MVANMDATNQPCTSHILIFLITFSLIFLSLRGSGISCTESYEAIIIIQFLYTYVMVQVQSFSTEQLIRLEIDLP